jgi:hypothetical protein
VPKEAGLNPRIGGFHRAWASQALLWGGTAKRLLEGGIGEAQLALVALHLCVKSAHQLIAGKGRIPPDEAALADGAPYDPGELKGVRDRFEGFRDEILHLSSKEQEGRGVTVSWTHDPPHFSVRSSIERERGKLEFDEITKAQITGIIEQLDPWLRRQWERLIDDGHDPDDAEALAAKINEVMRTIDGE